MRSSPPVWQSFDEKMRSDPLISRYSIWEVPTLTSHGGAVPPLVMVMVSSGFSSGP